MRCDKVGQGDRIEGKKDKDITALTDRSHIKAALLCLLATLRFGRREQKRRRGRGDDKPANLIISQVEEFGYHALHSTSLISPLSYGATLVKCSLIFAHLTLTPQPSPSVSHPHLHTFIRLLSSKTTPPPPGEAALHLPRVACNHAEQRCGCWVGFFWTGGCCLNSATSGRLTTASPRHDALT